MDYEQFFAKSEDHTCDNQVRAAILVVTIIYIILDLTLTCKKNRREKMLKQENETLKNVILQSVDRAFVRMMKNGNENDITEEQ
jgi:hypothetical protein